jgi:hypothetical protein
MKEVAEEAVIDETEILIEAADKEIQALKVKPGVR